MDSDAEASTLAAMLGEEDLLDESDELWVRRGEFRRPR